MRFGNSEGYDSLMAGAIIMDPELAWDEFALALLEGRPKETQEHAEALHGWLSKGGVIPKDMAQFNSFRGGKSRENLIDWIGCYV